MSAGTLKTYRKDNLANRLIRESANNAELRTPLRSSPSINQIRLEVDSWVHRGDAC